MNNKKWKGMELKMKLKNIGMNQRNNKYTRKKIVKGFSLGLAIMLMVTGCGSKQDKKENATTTNSQVAATQTPEITTAPNQKTMMVYYGDEEGEFIVSKEVTVKEVTGEEMVKQLIQVGVLDKKVVLNSIKIKTVKGKTYILLDFNQAFQKQLSGCGSSQERILMGSVVNTFLEGKGGDKVKITVEGKVLESGNEIYDKGIKSYKTTTKIYVTGEIKIGKDTKKVEMLRTSNGLGFAYEYDYKKFRDAYNEKDNTLSLTSKKEFSKGKPMGYFVLKKTTDTLETAVVNMMKNNQENHALKTVDTKIGKNEQFAAVYIVFSKDKSGLKKSYYIFQAKDSVWTLEMGGYSEGMIARLKFTLKSLDLVK